MRRILNIVVIVTTFFGFLGMAAFIGLWWMPDFARGNINASLMRATWILAVAAIMYHKQVWVLSRHHTPFHFYFYSVMAAITVTGYLYGILFRWL